MSADIQLLHDLKKADLRYTTDTIKGMTRKKENGTIVYFDTEGKKITSKSILERIKNLVIPPAWNNVWICPSPTGYLQATGLDEKGRKQYIYHMDWKKQMQENKFNKMVDFAQVLPKIRQKIYKDMSNDELDKEKIIATVVWLLEHTLIRIGNEEYAKENDSFGLTTLRNRHVKIRGEEVTFDFTGKSGVEHTVSITNPKIAKIIKQCFELPGYEIFQYMNGDEKYTVDSSSVNDYLKQITNEDITAKEFRTWGATVLGGETLFSIGPADNEKTLKHNIATAVKKVSQHLRNTASVCRTYYIHPTILQTYEKNILTPHFEKIYRDFDKSKTQLTRPEYATFTLLEKYS
ncbi:MAG TPA: DNA topoisomerase IB [Patescibacteria group bacterium]|nr:DNA topoisomerase IB [Patescibacteria group bacterium]